MTQLRAAITGVGGYVPDYVLTNRELETMVDTSDEWIRTRTGIVERRILKGDSKGTSLLGFNAAMNVINKTHTDPKDIDLVICATVTPDMVFPATATLIAYRIGATNAFGFDVEAACSGFIYALTTGAQFIESGRYKKVLVVGADKMSSILNYSDRTTCILFGDGGGAVLLEPTNEEYGIIDFIHKSDGSGVEFLHMKAGGSLKPATIETVQAREHVVFQEGATVFKLAVTNMADYSVKIMERNDLRAEDIAWLVPHQANKRILDATASRMGISKDKVMVNIDRYGNTTAGTIPLCLWDYESQLKRGDNIILAAFGGGFTWGSVYVKWAYNGSDFGN